MANQRPESLNPIDPGSISNSQWQVEIDRASSAEWSAMLNEFDDANFYQTSAYGEIRWGERNLSRIVLKRMGEVVAIAQFRIIRPTPLKFGIAYLRWGPLWERTGLAVDSEVPERMAKAIDEEYVKARKLCVRILPNAFDASTRAAVFQSAFSKFSCESSELSEVYRTILMDLSPSLEDIRKRLDKKWRNQLSRAEKNGLTVIAGRGSEHYKSFCSIYEQMFKRKMFKTTVDIDEFGRMQEMLSESQRMQILIGLEGDVPVAGLVASVMGDSAIYLLGATSDAGLQSKGAYLLQWTLISQLKERGVKWYDLGGIDPDENPGVYHFKKGFSGTDICQIRPLVASESAISYGITRASMVLKHAMRQIKTSFSTARSQKQVVAAG